jgi:hypothetical protein
MYYKDTYIEIRIGLGLHTFKKVTNVVPNLILLREVDKNVYEVVETFTSETELSTYPTDGKYKLSVSIAGTPIYFVYFVINDFFIKEFITQIKEVACKCKCGQTDLPCHESKQAAFAIKRQKMFNLMTILPYTIKPVSYGRNANNNMYLTNFFQAYVNSTIDEKFNDLKSEYFIYFTVGSNEINTKLFNNLIGMYYYGLYYYSKKLLLINANSNYNTYLKIIDDFFNTTLIKSCLKCDVIPNDIEKIMDDVFANPCDCDDNGDPSIPTNPGNNFEQDNFSRVITVVPSNLNGNGTLEEKIARYVNTLNYNKLETDSDIWIQFDSEAVEPEPVNCVVSNWSEWSICSINGTQSRTRTIITSPSNGGTACPVLSETRICTYTPPIIPINAIVSNWSEWGVCSLDGFQVRNRYVITAASGGGTTPVLSETRTCTPIIVSPTPVDAIVSEWSEWSLCSAEGYTTRTRTVITPASNGGGTPILVETNECVYGTGRQRVLHRWNSPCGYMLDIWVSLDDKYYTDEVGPAFYTGYIYDFAGQSDQVGLEFTWEYVYVQSGTIEANNYGTVISSCNPYANHPV